MPVRYPKEQMHRIKYTKLTPEQISVKLAAVVSGPTSASPLSDVLAGKSLKIIVDGGPALSYRFTGNNPMAARLARLEDVDAIRALNQAFARQVSAGQADEIGIDPSIRIVAAHEFGERDVIELLPDHQTATCRMHCTVQIETVIGPSCPLVEMAREQGGGVVTRSETGVFENAFFKRDGVWTIQRSAYHRDP